MNDDPESPARIFGVLASMVSMIMALCSIILGLLLSKQVQAIDATSIPEIVC